MIHKTAYAPIDCNFYDELTLLAMRGSACEVVYRRPGEEPVRLVDSVEDVFTKGPEEFIRLGGGEVVRLDHLVTVAGKAVPDAAQVDSTTPGDGASCGA